MASIQGELVSKQLELSYLTSFSSRTEANVVQLQQQIGIMEAKLKQLEDSHPVLAVLPAPAAGAGSGSGSASQVANPNDPNPTFFPDAMRVPELRFELEQLLREQKIQETVFFAADPALRDREGRRGARHVDVPDPRPADAADLQVASEAHADRDLRPRRWPRARGRLDPLARVVAASDCHRPMTLDVGNASSARSHAWPPKQDVLGVGISRTSFDELIPLFAHRLQHRAVSVNVCNVHSVMSARRDRELSDAFATSDINTPDGMPLVWFLRSLGFSDQTRVNGSEIALRAIEYGLSLGWRHFFYGSTDETLALLVSRLTSRFPSLKLAGTVSPPFRSLSPDERVQTVQTIRDTRPDIVWVGLGMPKQEKWMREFRDELPGTVLVGIGAVFDFLAGTKPQAPQWVQDNGLEWLFRFGTEPRRLWRRYFWNNPAFLALWMQHMAKSLRPIPGPENPPD